MKKIPFAVKIFVFALAAIVVFLSISIVKTEKRNNRITNELTEIAKSYGLKNIKITIGGKISGYDFYDVKVESSNFGSLSYTQMFNICNSMSIVKDAFVSKFTSGGNSYEVFPSTKSIYKNGSEIYDDYWNSESYKAATKNNESKKDYSSSSSKSSSHSYIPHKSYSNDDDDDDDPYNAKDYSDEEDFYEDHYDDFFDYYDAEDYYREHND